MKLFSTLSMTPIRLTTTTQVSTTTMTIEDINKQTLLANTLMAMKTSTTSLLSKTPYTKNHRQDFDNLPVVKDLHRRCIQLLMTMTTAIISTTTTQVPTTTATIEGVNRQKDLDSDGDDVKDDNTVVHVSNEMLTTNTAMLTTTTTTSTTMSNLCDDACDTGTTTTKTTRQRHTRVLDCKRQVKNHDKTVV